MCYDKGKRILSIDKNDMKITFYGHACFGVQIGEIHILFDPFISGNPAAKAINVEEIPADFIFLSHGHQDHVLDAASIASRTGAKLISNYEIVSWYQGQGFDNVHPLNHGGNMHLDFGRVKYVNAIHSSVLPDGTYGGNPGGFVFKTAEKTFYYSGDTALTYDMKLIAEEFQVDFAFLCIGDNFTMGVQDGIKAAQFVETDHVVGMHFDTFPPIAIDHDKAVADFQAVGKTLKLPKIGESFEM